MWEKLNYNNWITEKLDIVVPDINKEQTKEDLYTLKMLYKIKWEWLKYEEIMELTEKYTEQISPIISAIDYEWITDNEVKKIIYELKDISEIDRLIIYFLMFSYFLKDDY